MKKVIGTTLDKSNKILCQMGDGSRWECDEKGENWVEKMPSYEELTDKFNESNPE